MLLRAGIALLLLGTLPFLVATLKLKRAVSARDGWATRGTVISVSSRTAEVGYLDRERVPRTAVVRAGHLQPGQTIPVMVSATDPSVAWLDHEGPPGAGDGVRWGLLAFGLWISGGTLTLLSLRRRTDRPAA